MGLTKTAIKKVLGRRHVSLPTLETIVVEIEAVLNDRPLTLVSSELEDLEPLTPAHLLHGRRITCLPYQTVDTDEIDDPSYGEASQVCRRAKIQAAILRDFQKRWCHEYLTSLRDFHKASGSNKQDVKKGDVVLVHDDAPRVTWKMAVIQDLMVGGDGLVRAATIRTATGITSRSITRLYSLELSLDNQSKEPREHPTMSVQQPSEPHPVDSAGENSRPQRASAKRATIRVKKWARVLAAPPEDVAATEQ